VVLSPGSVQETIMVTGEAALLQAENAEVARNFETTSVTELPIADQIRSARLQHNPDGRSSSCVRIDCADFQHSHHIAKLIGSPRKHRTSGNAMPAEVRESVLPRGTGLHKTAKGLKGHLLQHPPVVDQNLVLRIRIRGDTVLRTTGDPSIMAGEQRRTIVLDQRSRACPSVALVASCLILSFLPVRAQVNVISTVAGNGDICCTPGDGFDAKVANVATPMDAVMDGSGNLYVTSAQQIRRVLRSGVIETLVTFPGQGFGVPSPLSALAIDAAGNIYVAEAGGFCRVLRIDKAGTTTTIAGFDSLLANFQGATDGENVSGRSVRLQFHLFGHNGLAVDQTGNVYISDGDNDRIRRLSPSGVISTYAGRKGVSAFGGDGQAAVNASLNTPRGLAVDKNGNLYIADTLNHRIRRVDANGIITTFAGSGGPAGGFAGDGGAATSALLNRPEGVAVDSDGTVYITDTQNSRVRRVSPNGVITTIAGSGARCPGDPCYSGDNGPAVSAQLSLTSASATPGNDGAIYIGDTGNNRVRKVLLNATPTQVPPPSITQGVASASTFEDKISVGSWATVFGENLAPVAPPGRTWRNDEIVNGTLPTSLDGVSVTIDGRAAYVYFIGPKQINFLVPDGVRTGSVPVQVRTPSGTATGTANVRVFAPSFFRIGASQLSSTYYAAAVHQDGTLVGSPTSTPGARPARPGEAISVFGTGFGPTVPSRAVGQVSDPAAIGSDFTLNLDLDVVRPTFAGIVSPGLYQFNFVVPASAGRSSPEMYIYVTIGGESSYLGTVIAVQQ
jgi:uncharacterized protein (TIGR03437 family)